VFWLCQPPPVSYPFPDLLSQLQLRSVSDGPPPPECTACFVSLVFPLPHYIKFFFSAALRHVPKCCFGNIPPPLVCLTPPNPHFLKMSESPLSPSALPDYPIPCSLKDVLTSLVGVPFPLRFFFNAPPVVLICVCFLVCYPPFFPANLSARIHRRRLRPTAPDLPLLPGLSRYPPPFSRHPPVPF